MHRTIGNGHRDIVIAARVVYLNDMTAVRVTSQLKHHGCRVVRRRVACDGVHHLKQCLNLEVGRRVKVKAWLCVRLLMHISCISESSHDVIEQEPS